MGIHYNHKSKAGDRKMQKQLKLRMKAEARKQKRLEKEAEEQAQIVAVDAVKRAQEEEVLQEETETERRKDVFEQIREFAETDPTATADVLRTWLVEEDDSTSEADSANSEVSETDEES